MTLWLPDNRHMFMWEKKNSPSKSFLKSVFVDQLDISSCPRSYMSL